MAQPNDDSIPYGPKQIPWRDQVPPWASVTGPRMNPEAVYEAVPPVAGPFPKIDYTKFELPPTGLSGEEYDEAMAQLEAFVRTQHQNFTGYQTNQYLPDNQELSWLLDIHTNNVGDPYTTGIFSLNTKFVERAVLDYFAALWRADWPYTSTGKHADDSYWGYVMSMGSTEGNIYALYNGREYLSGGKLVRDPDSHAKSREKILRGKFALEKKYKLIRPRDYEDNPNKYKPIAFYSEDTHYSVIKGVSMCSVTTFYEEGRRNYPNDCPVANASGKYIWPEEVPSHNALHDDPKSGTIDVGALEKFVRFFVEKGHPVLIVLNQGSTWKGAYDNVPEVHEMLRRIGEDHPELWERTVEYEVNGEASTDRRRGFWLHVDGALGAAYLPFLRMAQAQGHLKDKKVPEFDFSIPSVMSVVCSMHKWIGGPWPGGIYMTRRKYQLSPPDTAGYIGSPDTTLGGSRNGFSPVLLWKYFARNSYGENINRALETERVARHFETELRKLEADLKKQHPDEDIDLWIHRSELSLAVLFRKVNDEITYKYTVDSERITVPVKEHNALYSEDRTYSHIYSMTSLGEYGLAEKLIGDIREACKKGWINAFPDHWEEDGKQVKNPGDRKLLHTEADTHESLKKGISFGRAQT